MIEKEEIREAQVDFSRPFAEGQDLYDVKFQDNNGTTMYTLASVETIDEKFGPYLDEKAKLFIINYRGQGLFSRGKSTKECNTKSDEDCLCHFF